MKIEGRFQLQTKTDGIVDMLVVDFDAPDRLRAFARFDAARLDAAAGRLSPAELLGQGHLALTIDQGPEMSRYQGVVPLEGQGLEAAAHQYFIQSEQIPTLIRLAVAQNVTGEGSHWRAGGLMVQFLPESEDRRRQVDLDPGDAPPGFVRDTPEDDSWAEGKALASTVEDHELVDPTLSSERLLFRLFHERGVTVFEPQSLRDACRCSRERIEGMLRSFTPGGAPRHDRPRRQDRRDLRVLWHPPRLRPGRVRSGALKDGVIAGAASWSHCSRLLKHIEPSGPWLRAQRSDPAHPGSTRGLLRRSLLERRSVKLPLGRRSGTP